MEKQDVTYPGCHRASPSAGSAAHQGLGCAHGCVGNILQNKEEPPSNCSQKTPGTDLQKEKIKKSDFWIQKSWKNTPISNLTALIAAFFWIYFYYWYNFTFFWHFKYRPECYSPTEFSNLTMQTILLGSLSCCWIFFFFKTLGREKKKNSKMTPSLSKNLGNFVLHTDKRHQRHFIKEMSQCYLLTLLQRKGEWQPVWAWIITIPKGLQEMTAALQLSFWNL